MISKEVMNVLNKKSGVFGLSGGISSDFRDLRQEQWLKETRRRRSHWKYSAYRVAKYIGAYAAAMNGVDDIVFTAGIGENDKLCTRAGMQLSGISWC